MARGKIPAWHLPASAPTWWIELPRQLPPAPVSPGVWQLPPAFLGGHVKCTEHRLCYYRPLRWRDWGWFVTTRKVLGNMVSTGWVTTGVNACSFYSLPGIWPWLSLSTEHLDLDTPVSYTN